jgi:ectoine hydroxylase-related dioxygenase (phytanoyl-CoA dioxygenase family)
VFLVDCKHDPDWLPKTLEGVRQLGYAVVGGVLESTQVERVRARMYDVQQAIRDDIGSERLERAGELGVLRLMVAYDEEFLLLLELPQILEIVDSTVSPTAILHLQNGFILPPQPGDNGQGGTFQQSFHRDFPRYLDGYLCSVNTLLTLDDFSAENGGTIIVAGTHQRAERPDDGFLEAAAEHVECPAGSAIVFDSTLWHAAGLNRSTRDRVAINEQFTRSFIKQQVDYVRALGDQVVERQSPRTQQLLGWYTRVVTSLDEYYQPAERRLYRAGQG